MVLLFPSALSTEQYSIIFHAKDRAFCWQGQYITIDTQQDWACRMFLWLRWKDVDNGFKQYVSFLIF